MKQWLRETHGPGFELLRHFLRRFFDSEEKVAAQGVTVTNDEPAGMRDEAVEGRLNAMLYF